MKVRADLHRLARFGANISDAHSCFIFLPIEMVASLTCTPLPAERTGLVVGGYHSLTTGVIEDCLLPRGAGLIGWVSKHGRVIHVSPFERDSRTLGIYSNDQQLKSFIGIPVLIETDRNQETLGAGVIACDSKKSFAFSKLQAKLLENLAAEVSNTIHLLMLYNRQGQADLSWQTFLRRSDELASALGIGSIEVLRLKPANFGYLETILGTAGTLHLAEQVFRLVQQALPPHFPFARLSNGDMIVCLDNMMTSFYENKIRAVCEHIAAAGRRPQFQFLRASCSDRKRKTVSIEALVTETAQSELVNLDREVGNEYRRA